MQAAGVLILVVGPSGAGKDTLLDAARAELANDARFRFVRRVITRPAGAGGENHEAVTEAEFARRTFSLSWQAHGLRYGLPADIADDIRAGRVVVANASRAAIAEAARRFPVRVIEVVASAATLASRLAARGRETEADIAARLGRQAEIPTGVRVVRIANDGAMAEGIGRFLAALTECAR